MVKPIELMVDIVQKIARNPKLQLEATKRTRFETDAVRIALAKIVGLMQVASYGLGRVGMGLEPWMGRVGQSWVSSHGWVACGWVGLELGAG